MLSIDATNDGSLRSWVASANSPDSHFPIQNLPYGVFSPADRPPRVGVAIGDQVLDLAVLETSGVLTIAGATGVFGADRLNPFMALGPAVWRSTRSRLSRLLQADQSRLRDDRPLRQKALYARDAVTLHLPFAVSEYTDFYASREHATHVGSMFRDPKNALMPNWLHLPVGYNGRASTVVVSGTDIRRPLGQVKPPDAAAPVFGPSGKLDIELEIGAVVGTPNPMGEPVTVAQAEDMIFGYVILNDWSARDIQVWEYQPLGPFQAKVFASTISPWVVTAQALAPFRVDGPAPALPLLPYLRQTGPMNLDIHLEAAMRPAGGTAGTVICRTNVRHLYWSSAQQLAHHAVGGCAMRPGDLLGSGTISGPDKGSFGSLLEMTWNGQTPLTLEGGATRTFIEDGDRLTLTGWARGDGYRIGFGECAGTVVPAPDRPDWL